MVILEFVLLLIWCLSNTNIYIQLSILRKRGMKLKKRNSAGTVLPFPIFSVLFCVFVDSSTCSALEAPTHGKRFGSKYLAGHEVHFTCSLGYHLVGSATRVCQENGSWSGVTALCKGLYKYDLIHCGINPFMELNKSTATPQNTK